MKRGALLFSVLSSATAAAWLVLACSSTPQSTDKITVVGPSPGDFSGTIGGVGPVFERHCGSFDCHGNPSRGMRTFPISKTLWIEEEDFMEVPSKGYFRLFPGNRVRLRYGYVVECTGCDKDENGRVIAVHCNYYADSKSGSEGSANYKVKGNIHWVSAAHALEAEIRLYDRLFSDPHPDAGGRDFKLALNPNAKTVVTAYLEPGMVAAMPEQRFQFERHGYFVADRVDSQPGKPVFNRIATLKDSWVK